MIPLVERYSSPARKRRTGLVPNLAKTLLVALLLFLVVTRFVVSTYRVESVSMEPTLMPADRVVVSLLAYGPRVPLGQRRLPGLGRPQRGDLVVVEPPFLESFSLSSRLLDPLVGFFSLQKATLHRRLSGSRVNSYMVKRIVGLPGDTLRLKDYVLSVKPKGGTDFVPEVDLSPRPYRTLQTPPGADWPASVALSGLGTDLTLGDGQYFVLGDDRPLSSDSRSWGPLDINRVIGKVVLRYWPPRGFGTL